MNNIALYLHCVNITSTKLKIKKTNRIKVMRKSMSNNEMSSETFMVTADELKSFALGMLENPIKEEYLTINQVCEMLGVVPSTLWRWNQSGYLKRIKVGKSARYRKSDINNLLSNQ